MALATLDDVFAAFLSAWPTTGQFTGVRLNALRRAAGDTASKYAVIKGRETAVPNFESDGQAEQQFEIEIAWWTAENPAPTGTYQGLLSSLYDGTPATPGAGLALPTSNALITLCQVQNQALATDGMLRAGNDVLVVSRKWLVVVQSK